METFEFRHLKQVLRQKIRKAEKHRNFIREHISILSPLREEKDTYPILHAKRGKIKYKYGDRVRVFAYSQRSRKKDQFTWQPATILFFKRPEEVGICFDHAVMNSREKRADFNKVSWPKHMWTVPHAHYYVMFEWEYHALRDLGEAHPFSKEWSAELDSRSYPYDLAYNGASGFDDSAVVKAVWNKSIIPQAKTDRLMSADEARIMLGLKNFPDKKEDVVRAFRTLILDTNQDLLRRAKDTLLARV